MAASKLAGASLEGEASFGCATEGVVNKPHTVCNPDQTLPSMLEETEP